MTIPMTAAATAMLTLGDRATKQFDEEVARAARESAERAAYERERSETDVLDALKRTLGVETVEYVILDGETAIASVDGLRFRYYRPQHGERYWRELQVEMDCIRCGKGIWVSVYSLGQLGSLLQSDHDHGTCLVQYDEDGEPTTDRDGNPLPPRAPQPPRLSPEQKARAAIAGIHVAAARVAATHTKASDLADQRALIKAAAIKRLIESGVASSATAAEKIVEHDEIYAAHRAAERETEIDRWLSLGEFEAAKLTARLGVALVEAENRQGSEG
jgi:hypothetical protein